jgi:hypothetical protein
MPNVMARLEALELGAVGGVSATNALRAQLDTVEKDSANIKLICMRVNHQLTGLNLASEVWEDCCDVREKVGRFEKGLQCLTASVRKIRKMVIQHRRSLRYVGFSGDLGSLVRAVKEDASVPVL